MSTTVNEGIWISGKASKEEMSLLTRLIEQAVKLFSVNGLPLRYDGEKLFFKAWNQGSRLHIFYGWKFPPTRYWAEDIKDETECWKCLPYGEDGEAGREVWCSKLDYNFRKCPYGVITEGG